MDGRFTSSRDTVQFNQFDAIDSPKGAPHRWVHDVCTLWDDAAAPLPASPAE